jgi:hypothetical protein
MITGQLLSCKPNRVDAAAMHSRIIEAVIYKNQLAIANFEIGVGAVCLVPGLRNNTFCEL